jgi:hypothetical protein
MKKIFLFFLLCMTLAVSGVNAAHFTDYNYNATESSLHFYFVEDLNPYEIYYDNELILYPITNEVFLHDLEADKDYNIVIMNNETKETQIVIGHTLSTDNKDFYMQYGLLGLFILIIAMYIVSVYIPPVIFIVSLLSGAGLAYCIKNGYGFIACLIFALLLLLSILFYSRVLKKEL